MDTSRGAEGGGGGAGDFALLTEVRSAMGSLCYRQILTQCHINASPTAGTLVFAVSWHLLGAMHF